jgi:hypothetical protein
MQDSVITQKISIDDAKLGEVPDGKLCDNCHKNLASIMWVGTGGGWALIHGHYQWWCKKCSLEEQLAHAKKLAAQIPEIEEQLKSIVD